MSYLGKIKRFANTTFSTSSLCMHVLEMMLKFGRFFYIGGALYFVCVGFYTTMLKVKENHVSIKEEIQVLPKYRYPSLTFCYVFKHGGKDVMEMFYQHLFDKWKQSGNWSFPKWHLSHIYSARTWYHADAT